MKTIATPPAGQEREPRANAELALPDPAEVMKAQRSLVVLRARRALLECLLCVGEATADEVRDVVELPADADPRMLGAVPGPLLKAGIICFRGFVRTCRPTGHGRPVTRWGLVNRAAAKRWLRDHSDRPGQGPVAPGA